MTDPTWLIEVDRTVCLGTGTCAVIAAAHFALVDGRAQAIETTVSPHEEIIDAADSCPAEAIVVRSAADGRVLAPGE